MRIFYVVYFGEKNIHASGVFKKIFGQIQALNIENEVTLCYCFEEKIYLLKNNEQVIFNTKKGLSNYRKSISIFLKKNSSSFDALYVRMPGFIDFYSYKLYKFLKRKNKKIILEIPTYPTGGEMKTTLRSYLKKGKILHFLSRSFSYIFHYIYTVTVGKYLFEIVTFMPYTNIWKTKTLVLDNGVNVKDCKPIIKIPHSGFNIIVVAKVAIWHGIDRCISGLYNYYKNENVTDVSLTIVGESEYCFTLKKMVKELGLDSKVFFVGEQSGEQLYMSYCKADLALGSLGMHRINMINGSTLKVKEYCSYGIPFVYGYVEKALSEDFPYALQVPPTDENIDINKLLEFVNSLNNKTDVSEKMHAFALSKYDWSIQMKPVIESLR